MTTNRILYMPGAVLTCFMCTIERVPPPVLQMRKPKLRLASPLHKQEFRPRMIWIWTPVFLERGWNPAWSGWNPVCLMGLCCHFCFSLLDFYFHPGTIMSDVPTLNVFLFNIMEKIRIASLDPTQHVCFSRFHIQDYAKLCTRQHIRGTH